jgi:hypothetical protein
MQKVIYQSRTYDPAKVTGRYVRLAILRPGDEAFVLYETIGPDGRGATVRESVVGRDVLPESIMLAARQCLTFVKWIKDDA